MAEPIFHRLADQDFFEALEWYSKRQPELLLDSQTQFDLLKLVFYVIRRAGHFI